MGLLTGKVALVTGAARGQGRSHAVRLAEEGADIVAVDIGEDIDGMPYPLARPEDLEHTAKLVKDTGRRVLARQVDVRSQEQLDAVVAEARADLGIVSITCANAGIVTMGKTWEMSERDWRDVIDVNLLGVWHTAKAVIPGMIEAGQGGCIVMTSSGAGIRAVANLSSYCATKFAIRGLVGTLAQELGQYSIRVNAVCPGLVETDMGMNPATYALFRPDLENPTQADVMDVFRSQFVLPLPWIDPVDVSNAIVWLASDAARHITGVSMPVDAGELVNH